MTTATADAPTVEAPAETPDPFANLATEASSTVSLKGKSEADIPQGIRDLVERSYSEWKASEGKAGILRVTLGTKEHVAAMLKHLKAYGAVRTVAAELPADAPEGTVAGRTSAPLTVRATVQGDGLSVHVKASDKAIVSPQITEETIKAADKALADRKAETEKSGRK